MTESKKYGYCGDLFRELSDLTDKRVIFKDAKTICPLILDVYIPSLKVAVCISKNDEISECNLSMQKAKKIHKQKLDACKEQGIYLFQIFEHQWILAKYRIMNFIKTIIGENKEKIPARKCIVDESVCKFFMNTNHIQGWGNGTIKYFNLIYNKKLVASMTASRHHRQNIIGKPIVMNRLCFREGCNVQGGASKLFSRFKEWAILEGYDRIISFSDNAWTEGKIYNILGFKMTVEYAPDYFYWDPINRVYFSKQSQKKANTGCPKEITERDWCYSKGLYRIYDCGKKLWEFKL